jgi:hypothetical protein
MGERSEASQTLAMNIVRPLLLLRAHGVAHEPLHTEGEDDHTPGRRSGSGNAYLAVPANARLRVFQTAQGREARYCTRGFQSYLGAKLDNIAPAGPHVLIAG